ncbi:hypothetical protein [Anaerococcus rubeinfantis]|uniref:hypothetical protein n=1 Tax=Anaerococcus rubeinfantis TaxID=1720199 RepID=UPI00073E885E|nr:hypothetical protein [Anaerococcus rubeinfantis]
MKEIILNKNENNWKKLEELLNINQERCRTRTLNLEDIKKLIEKIEKRLNDLGLPKCYRNNLKVHCNPFREEFAQAYKYTPSGTNIDLVYKNNNWRVLNAYRADCKGNNGKALEFIFTDNQKERILNGIKYIGF